MQLEPHTHPSTRTYLWFGREGRSTVEMLQCSRSRLQRGEAVADRQEVALLHWMADRRERPSQLGVRVTPDTFVWRVVQDDGELPAHQRYVRIRRLEY